MRKLSHTELRSVVGGRRVIGPKPDPQDPKETGKLGRVPRADANSYWKKMTHILTPMQTLGSVDAGDFSIPL